MQMNTVTEMSPARVVALFGALEPPPRLHAHPRLDKLQRLVVKSTRHLERIEDLLAGDVPMAFTENGLEVLALHEWRNAVVDVERLLTGMRTPEWQRFSHDVGRRLPQVGPRYRAAYERVTEKMRDFLLAMSVLLGTDFADREGVDLSTPLPDPPRRGPSVALDL